MLSVGEQLARMQAVEQRQAQADADERARRRAEGAPLSFADAAKGGIAPTRTSILPDVFAPAIAIPRTFVPQSYFDSTQLQRALLQQPPGDPIVSAVEDQTPGYVVGLHPSSQTPITVQFMVGGQPTSSPPHTLKPGEVFRPFGLPKGMKSGSFSGVRWGLPYGWLGGGGLATLVVFQTPDADVAWPGDAEVIFHRQRVQIVNSAPLPANAPLNWPLKFPWPNAVFGNGANATPQGAAPTIAVTRPTRFIMRLRMLAGLAAPADMRFIIQSTNDFDLGGIAGTTLSAAPVMFRDFTWGTYANSGGVGNLSVQHPLIEVTGELSRFEAENGGIVLVDLTGTLVNQFVDITRYGIL